MEDDLKLLLGFQKHTGKQISASEWNTDICDLFSMKKNFTACIFVTIFLLNCLGNNTAD